MFFVCKISQSKSLKNTFIWPNSKQIKSLTIQEIILDQLIQIQNILKLNVSLFFCFFLWMFKFWSGNVLPS
jgi:hypothetical protein